MIRSIYNILIKINIYLRLDGGDCGSGATGGGGTGEDETADVCDDFDDDDPPGIGDFDFSVGRFDGVVDNLLDLFGSEFDFHSSCVFSFKFGCKIRKYNPEKLKW